MAILTPTPNAISTTKIIAKNTVMMMTNKKIHVKTGIALGPRELRNRARAQHSVTTRVIHSTQIEETD